MDSTSHIITSSTTFLYICVRRCYLQPGALLTGEDEKRDSLRPGSIWLNPMRGSFLVPTLHWIDKHTHGMGEAMSRIRPLRKDGVRG
jgi:hypothetical protein